MFPWLLESTVIALALAILMLPICLFSRKRPALCHFLWLLVLLRLVMPPMPYSHWMPETWRGTVHQWLTAEARPPRMGVPELRQHTRMLQQRMIEDPEPRPWATTQSPEQDTPNDENLLSDLRVADATVDADKLEPLESTGFSLPAPLAPYDIRKVSNAMTDDLGLVQELHFDLAAQQKLYFALFLIWVTGAILQGLSQLRTWIKFWIRLRTAGAAPPEIQALTDRMAALLGVRSVPVVMFRGLRSPFLSSLGRTRLLWPTTGRQEDETTLHGKKDESIVVHELAHLRRRDHGVAWLETLASIIHWWNPLFWFIQKRMHWHAELACDAWVQETLPNERKNYADALREVEQSIVPERSAAPVLGVADTDSKSLDKRLRLIMNATYSPRIPPLAAGVALLLLIAFSPSLLDARASAATRNQRLDQKLEAEIHRASLQRLGSIYYANMDWKRTAEVYSQYLKEVCTCGESMHRLSVALIGLGKLDDASRWLEKQIAEGYAIDRALYNKACVAALRDKPDEAWRLLDAALAAGLPHFKEMTEDADLRILRDAKRGDPARYERCVAQAKEASQSFKKVKGLYEQRAWTEILPEAVALVDRCKESPSAGRLLAYARFRLGQIALAEQGFKEQLARKYRPASAHYSLASCAAAKGETDRALEQLRKAIDLGLDHPMQLVEESDFESLRDHPVFISLKNRALKLSRLEKQIQLWTEFGDWKAIEAAAQAALTDKDQKPETHGWLFVALGRAQLELGHVKDAEKTFRAQITLGYEPAEALFHLGCAAAVRKDKKGCLLYLSRSIDSGFYDAKRLYKQKELREVQREKRFSELVHAAADRGILERFRATDWIYLRDISRERTQKESKNPSAWHRLGWAELRLGNHPEARKAFRMQNDLGYSVETARYNIACSYALTGKIDDAFEWLEKSMDSGFVDPGHIEKDPDLVALHDDPRWSKALERCREIVRRNPDLLEKLRSKHR